MQQYNTNFKERLSKRIGMNDIHEITCLIQTNNKLKQKLYQLVYDGNDTIAYQAVWVLSHFSLSENIWLYNKQNELIDEVLICHHPGKRRLLLNLLYRQPLAVPPRTDFLDFCLEKMISKDELPGVKTLCIKLAYELCRTTPELLQEFCLVIDIMQTGLLPPSIQTVTKNVLKAMRTRKSLQHY